MPDVQSDIIKMETACGSLLYELQVIWDEVGETESDKDRMLLELEQECLEVYRRKVDQANRNRAQLRQTIADFEAELAAICSAMGERPLHIRQVSMQSDQNAGSLKEELKQILPQLEEMRKRKSERRNQFLEVIEQIARIAKEISGNTRNFSSKQLFDETDLSSRKLEELHRQLHALQTEKSQRLKQIQDYLETLYSLCSVLGFDYKQTISQVDPRLNESEGPKSISDHTIEQLAAAIQRLREVKLQRMQKLQDLATTLLELWNLMDTPIEEQQEFQNVTCNIAASEDEITEPNRLSSDNLKYVEAEVARLDELKSSKMKELVFKKRSELEDICKKTHMIPECDGTMEHIIEAIESGDLDPADALEQFEVQIAKVKEEAYSRKEILDKVEKWLNACEEESWLEEYNRDDNRYNAGRGAHLALKRAEKARALVNKLPGMVEALASKTIAWEQERGIQFYYDGIRLLSMLEEYTILRQEKEQERRRQRDQKKLQGQLIAEQEALYGSKPSPSKTQCGKKGARFSTGGASNRRLSLGGAVHQTPKPDPYHSAKATPRTAKKSNQILQNNHFSSRQDDGFAALSTGRRGLDVAGLPARIESFGANSCEPQSPLPRKPFSPIPTTIASKANMNVQKTAPCDVFQKVTHGESFLKTTQGDVFQKTARINDSPFSTPLKTTMVADEEKPTPKAMPIPLPSTPATISVPMNTAATPAPPAHHQVIHFTANVANVPEDIEYSFEERRAGFMVSNAQVKLMT